VSTTNQIFLLVVIAIVGYVIDGVVFAPVIRVAWRQSNIAATGFKGLAILCGWMVGFLLALVVAHLAGWHPGHTYVLLAAILVVHAWGLLLWWLRWSRRIDRMEHEE
jgi:hypothetical protein